MVLVLKMVLFKKRGHNCDFFFKNFNLRMIFFKLHINLAKIRHQLCTVPWGVRKQHKQLTADTVRKVENTQSAKMNVFYKNNEK